MGYRRWGTRVGRLAIAAVMAVATGLVASPARAAETATFSVFVNDTTIAGLGAPPKDLVISVFNDGAVDPKVTFDLDPLHEIVQVGLAGESPCSFVDSDMVCEFPDDTSPDRPLEPMSIAATVPADWQTSACA